MVTIGYATAQEEIKQSDESNCHCVIFCNCEECDMGEEDHLANEGMPKDAVIILCSSCENKELYM